ncbi:E1-E2 ATPase [Hamiltosporidium tvaerminnensis]|uniref:E1-E2 ATPase n=1 Tax=Hamiltosporidium tvaerminnensis TaxID=1176355 RepID=A0A4Q9L3J1_9MICR|nr:Sarcoplasmic/endoplasmic reticulum calcium ATPase 2 [Hamiltosporidium tvaerminnensis]TBU02069.1 E1-E2 ATPase [Hamiltosporidium tvaerminnensis]
MNISSEQKNIKSESCDANLVLSHEYDKNIIKSENKSHEISLDHYFSTGQEKKPRKEKIKDSRIEEFIFSALFSPLQDKLSLILLISSLLNFLLAFCQNCTKEDIFEFFNSISVILISSFLEAFQDYKNALFLEKSRLLLAPKTLVLRNKLLNEETYLFKNDIIYLRPGDIVPTESLLIESSIFKETTTTFLSINESAITGESHCIFKKVLKTENFKNLDEIYMHLQKNSNLDTECTSDTFSNPSSHANIKTKSSQNISISKEEEENEINGCLMRAGSFVIHGSSYALVLTDMDNNSISELRQKLEKLHSLKKSSLLLTTKKCGDVLSIFIAFFCIILFIVGTFRSVFEFNVYFKGDRRNIGVFNFFGSIFVELLANFKFCVSLAITAIPEGLELTARLCLSYISQKLQKKGVLIKDSRRIESLSKITTICTDKTGTLTTNEHIVSEIYILKNKKQEIESLKVSNALENSGVFESVDFEKYFEHKMSRMLFKYCNHLIEVDSKPFGDPLELAMADLYSDFESDSSEILHVREEIPVSDSLFSKTENSSSSIIKLPFCPENMFMKVKITNNDGKEIFIVKGAPENILKNATDIYISNGATTDIINITDTIKNEISDKIKCLSENSFRIIGCCVQIDNKNIFHSLISFIDPPRNTVEESIKWCQNENINIIVITGDSLLTTKSICNEVGIIENSKEVFLSGIEFYNMKEMEFQEILPHLKIIYRAEPKHKLRLISLLKKKGDYVLMCGDGVNDVLAIKASDFGVGMGSGTEICKETSDCIIKDDDFSKIVECIQEGRTGLHNVFCILKYLLSSNLGELILIGLCYFNNIKPCFNSYQLMFINMLTDGLPACFLCFNKKGKCKANYFTIIRGILIGFYIGIGGFLVYKNTLQNIFYNTKVQENPGLALTFILFSEMVNSLNNIDLNESIFLTYQNNFKVVGCVVMCVSILIGAIKHGRICGYMGIENVDVSEALFVLSLSFGVLVIDEIMKVLNRLLY